MDMQDLRGMPALIDDYPRPEDDWSQPRIYEQEHCLMHTPSCVRDETGAWVRPNEGASPAGVGRRDVPVPTSSPSPKGCDTASHGDVENPQSVQPNIIRYTFRPCCGLTRTLPLGTAPGDTFTLVPCVKCGSTFYGKLHADNPLMIEELPEPEAPHAAA